MSAFENAWNQFNQAINAFIQTVKCGPNQKAIERIADLHAKIVYLREGEIYREHMKELMPPDIFATIDQVPMPEATRLWILNSGISWQYNPDRYKEAGFTCKEVTRNGEVLFSHICRTGLTLESFPKRDPGTMINLDNLEYQ